MMRERPSTTLAAPLAGAPGVAAGYPRAPELLPDFDVAEGRYRCRFARTADELRAVQRLRFEVFNLELGEGLAGSAASGLDHDRFDAHCHHLLVEDVETGDCVGTYRLQTAALAAGGHGFYTAQEYQLDRWPAAILEGSVEIGRACIARRHRHRQVLLVLWRGLGAYVMHNRGRYFFGCCSITSQDPAVAARVLAYLRHHGHLHPDLDAQPQPDYDCHEDRHPASGWEQTRLPTLFRTYLRYGAKICGRPALDREFQTIDYLALLDVYELDPGRILRQFEVDIRRQP